MRTILVGDIHGCLDEFRDLLDAVKYTPDDRLILLGDLVDRGPNSLGVIQFARLVRAELVLGNHDDKALRYINHERKRLEKPSYKNPMKPNQEYTDLAAGLSDADVVYLAGAKPFIQFRPGWTAVHAGVIPGVPAPVNDPRVLRVVRYIDPTSFKTLSLEEDYSAPAGGVPWTSMHKGPDKIVFGHWASLDDQTNKTDWAYPTDYGCVFGGQLAAWVFQDADQQEPDLVCVRARGVYASLAATH